MNAETKRRLLVLIESIRPRVIEIETCDGRIDYIISQINECFHSKGLLDAVRDDNITSMVAFQDRFSINPLIEALEVYKETGVKNRIVDDNDLDDALMRFFEMISSSSFE